MTYTPPADFDFTSLDFTNIDTIFQTAPPGMIDQGTCKHCGRDIYRLNGPDFGGVTNVWKHKVQMSRSCRTESFDAEKGTTDKSIPESWRAVPSVHGNTKS